MEAEDHEGRDAGLPWRPRFARSHAALWAYVARARRLESLADFPDGAELERALFGPEVVNARGAALRVVLDAPRPKRRRAPRLPIDPCALYDGRIHERAELPTRSRSWHDLLGALQWACFPKSKARINARQWAALRRWIPEGASTLPSARLREQDALAMLDEGGLALLVARGASGDAEAAVAGGDRAALAELVRRGLALAVPFGHAVTEHLVCGRGPVRAMPVVLEAEGALPARAEDALREIDALLAARLGDAGFCAVPSPHAAVELDEALFASAPSP